MLTELGFHKSAGLLDGIKSFFGSKGTSSAAKSVEKRLGDRRVSQQHSYISRAAGGKDPGPTPWKPPGGRVTDKHTGWGELAEGHSYKRQGGMQAPQRSTDNTPYHTNGQRFDQHRMSHGGIVPRHERRMTDRRK